MQYKGSDTFYLEVKHSGSDVVMDWLRSMSLPDHLFLLMSDLAMMPQPQLV